MAKMFVKVERFLEEVVKASKVGETWDDVSSRLGIKKESCIVRASNLRKAGLNLPNLSRAGGGRRLDIAALAKMVSDLQATEAVVETDKSAEVAVVNEVGESVTPVVEEVQV